MNPEWGTVSFVIGLNYTCRPIKVGTWLINRNRWSHSTVTNKLG